MHSSWGAILGIATTLLVSTYTPLHSHTSIRASNCSQVHKFINPDLDCLDTDNIYEQINSIEGEVTTLIESEIKNGNASRISVFYRDLNTRKWFGINENESYAPGSLLKLPLAIAYFKLSEVDQGVLNQEILFPEKSENLNLMQNIPPPENITAGKTYSSKELIRRMISYSDNDALTLLAEHIPEQYSSKVYIDLGVYFPTSGGIEQNFVNVKTYAGILRLLYNASYLGIDTSEKILGMMANSSFTLGIRAGVPDGISTANKFGDRSFEGSNGKMVHQLHDCGVIYKTKEPYILCIMTEGADIKSLEKIISKISKITYETQ